MTRPRDSQKAIVKALALSAVALGGSGCWPAWKTTQRERSFVVVGETGEPVGSARVAYVTLRYPYGEEDDRKVGVTGADGRVAFKAEREWQTETMMMHGANAYAWRWCVSAAGYETVHSKQDWGSEAKEVVVRLRRGVSKPCSAAPEIFIQPSAAPIGSASPDGPKAPATADGRRR